MATAAVRGGGSEWLQSLIQALTGGQTGAAGRTASAGAAGGASGATSDSTTEAPAQDTAFQGPGNGLGANKSEAVVRQGCNCGSGCPPGCSLCENC